MKALRIAVILAIAMVIPVLAWGQTASLSLMGTGTLPVKELDNFTDPGGGGAVEVFIPLLTSYLHIGGRVAYNTLDNDSDRGNKGRSWIWEFVPALRLQMMENESDLNAYIEGGYGWYRWKIRNEINGTNRDNFKHTDDGGFVAVGMVGRLGEHVNLVVQPQYNMINTSDRAQVNDNDLFYWSFNVGIQIY
jgi:hypothetical protein